MATLFQINAVYGKGSTGVITKDISQMVLDNGWKSYVACAETGIDEQNGTQLIKVGNKFDHKLHAALSRVLGLHGYFSIRATKVLLKQIEKIEPDIIHIHNLHSNYINVNMLFRFIKKNRITTIITLHDCWFFTGKCYHYLYNDCQKWKEHCRNCPRLRAEIPSLLFDFSSVVFDDRRKWIGENEKINVVGVSQWITKEAEQSLLSKRVIGTIYNGVDLSVYSPKNSTKRKKLELEGKYVLLGMANKWLASENKETYIRFRQYCSVKKNNWVLVLVGCPNEMNREDNIVFYPYVNDRTELAELYSMADLFVNITKVDSLPTVSIEALACGTPIVTYASGGSAELVDENVGIAVPYGDIDQLFSAIEKMENIGKKALTSNCVQRAEKKHNIVNCYKDYLRLYEQLIKLQGETKHGV